MDNKQEAKYIERIEIKGLWGRYDVDWKLNPDVNILVGENGTGKSTILKMALNLCAVSSYLRQKTDIDQNIFKELFKDTEFSAFILHFDKERYYSLVKSLIKKGFVLECDPETKARMGNPETLNGMQVELLSTFDDFIVTKFDFSSIPKKRTIRTTLDIILDETIDEYVEYQLNLNKKLRANGKTYDKVFEKQNYFIQVLNRLFLNTEKKVDENENRLAFLLPNNTKIAPYQLSAGEKQLLIILLTVLCHDEKPSILLLDEPEISLHVEWQYELIKIIKELNPNCQLIIVTHSTSIFSKGWMDKLFYMKGKEGILNPTTEKI
jgi:predicted ATP-dependent endonuclease of OLD family